ncbi:MAG: LLM class flavin-dependent oxidoreductase [Sphaerobacter sp.]|nr:LLM class flavin-dependent oxidoreductase [Sphaerobacter sp.]
MTLAVDIRVPLGLPLPALTDFIRGCEAAGFRGVGIHDHHHIGRDCYVALAAAAATTSTLALYPVTSNTVTRHPLVLAALATSLTELAPGRSFITVGPGFLSVEGAGERRASLADLRRAVLAIRRLLAGETVEFNGVPVQLRTRPVPPPPVLLTASGPRLLELAGEVADGAVMLVGLDARMVRAARAHLAAGAARAERDPATLREIFITPIAVGDRAVMRQWPRQWFRPGQPWLAYPSRSTLHWLREAGVDLPPEHDPSAISEAQAETICDLLGLFGPAEYCAERLLRAREEAEVARVFLFPAHTAATSYELPWAEVEAFRRVIGPRLVG